MFCVGTSCAVVADADIGADVWAMGDGLSGGERDLRDPHRRILLCRKDEVHHGRKKRPLSGTMRA